MYVLFMPTEITTAQEDQGIIAWAITPIINLFVRMAVLLLAMVNAIFVWSIQLSVTHFSSLISKMTGINTGWIAARDVANLFFIFILLYTAIAHILDLGGVNIKKTVIKVIIVALFINFSLVMTRVVIDSGNVLATFFYERTGLSTNTDLPQTLGLVKSSGILKARSDESVGLAMKDFLTSYDGTSTAIQAMGTLVFILALAFVLGAAAIMFLWRSVVLIFLMVISPMAFLFSAVPGKEGLFGEWWSKLLSTTFFAPVYLLFMYISIVFIKGGEALKEKENIPLDPSLGFVGNTIGEIGFYIVGIGLLIASMYAAQKMGARFASGAISKFHSGLSTAGNFAQKNLINRPIRSTASKLAYKAASNETMRKFAAKNWILGGAQSALQTGGKYYKEAKDKTVKTKMARAKELATDRSGDIDTSILKDYADRQGKRYFGLSEKDAVFGATGIEARKKILKDRAKERQRQGYRDLPEIKDPETKEVILKAEPEDEGEYKKRKSDDLRITGRIEHDALKRERENLDELDREVAKANENLRKLEGAPESAKSSPADKSSLDPAKDKVRDAMKKRDEALKRIRGIERRLKLVEEAAGKDEES